MLKKFKSFYNNIHVYLYKFLGFKKIMDYSISIKCSVLLHVNFQSYLKIKIDTYT